MEDGPSSHQPWQFRQSFIETPSWFPQASAHETEETLAGALQISLSTDAGVVAACCSSSPVGANPANSPSEVDQSAPRRTQNPAFSPAAGKVSKRKRRPSKRSTPTFIYTDLASFRQIVQQVTGTPLGRTQAAAEVVLRPKPLRPGKQVEMEGGSLPTLDASTFFLEQAGGEAAAASTAAPCPGSQTTFGLGHGESGFVTDPPFLCFPTMDSWGIM